MFLVFKRKQAEPLKTTRKHYELARATNPFNSNHTNGTLNPLNGFRDVWLRLPITIENQCIAFKGFTTQQSDLKMALPLNYKTIHAMVCFDALNLGFRLLILIFAALTRS